MAAANQPPVLKLIKARRVRAGRRLRIKLSAKDPNHNLLIFSMSRMPDGATFDPMRRTFQWIPAPNQVGPYNLTASVSDALTNVTTPVTITVY